MIVSITLHTVDEDMTSHVLHKLECLSENSETTRISETLEMCQGYQMLTTHGGA